MALTYTNAAKAARMNATREHFAGGAMEILAGNNTVLASFDITAAGGTVDGPVWTVAFEAMSTEAVATGTAASARFVTSDDDADLTGFTVGLTGSDAQLKLSTLSFNEGQNVLLDEAKITHANGE